MKKILITGADGFIGSHLVELATQKGYSVKAFCLYNSFGSFGWLDSVNSETKENVEVVLGDIRDPISVRDAMKNCEHVFHLASLISIPYSYSATASYIDTNIKGTLNVLQAAKDLGISKLVHTSTSETYGTAKFVPINENHEISAQSPYAATKIAADQLAISFWRSFQTPVTILRPFNTYGPRQSTRAVIPTIIGQILRNQEYLNLGSLTPTRDFNYVSDTCHAFLEVSESEEVFGEVINVASNFEISIRETAEIISYLMNSNIKIKSDDKRIRPENSEVFRLFGDNSKLKKFTNWNPRYIGKEGFKKGLQKTIEWFSEERNLDKYNFNKFLI